MFEFFVSLSLLGWGIFITMSIIIISLLEYENFGWAIFCTLLAFALVHYFIPSWSVITWAMANPWQLVANIVMYIFAGIVWSFIRWFLFVKDTINEYKDKLKYAKENSTINYIGSAKSHMPEVRHYKSMLSAWIAYWPWSAFWFLFHDFFSKLVTYLTKAYDSITESQFKKYLNNEEV